jgi:hypothetical protein
MAKKLKALPRTRVDEILQRVEDDPTLTPDEQKLIREVFEYAIRIGLVKIKK